MWVMVANDQKRHRSEDNASAENDLTVRTWRDQNEVSDVPLFQEFTLSIGDLF